jgi:hypothetical protein
MMNSKKKIVWGMAIATCVGLIPTTLIYAQNLSRPDVVAQAATNLQALTNAEVEGLKFMREEEKMTRDVYQILGDRWNLRSFSNIKQAEQRHMDQVKTLMQSYGVADPVISDRVGEFANPELADMYKQLVQRGQSSLPEALKVGALIEETDIKDLRDRLNATANPQIKATYGYLLQGSYNHLQAFVRQIERQGGSYIPQVLSQQELTEILAQGHRSGWR